MNVRRVCWVGLATFAFVLIAISLLKMNPKFNQFQTLVDFTETQTAAGNMSAKEIFRYLHWTNSTSCLFAVDFGYWVWNGGGVAAPDGHKAVCLDQFISPVYDNCLVYSFGINNQWTFDEAMAKFGCQVYSFDPSMGVGDYDRSRHIHFHNLGLSGKNEAHPTTKWNMKTASSIYEMLGHQPTLIDVLKMDIEFYEWDAIPQMLRSGFLADKVKQLAVEIHFNANDTLETFRRYVGILQDLESTGRFVRFSSRPNPWLKRPISILGGQEDYVGMELTWYNSRFYNSSSVII
ncbi:probable methyltransferase-like protein 24 [Daphnia pulicaria]|uniref:probable methyltransferase-like protein 24 n=1 Tax=Daphnia pulicaria TaxID=35523 RepID=UPI001EEA3610|nr:probable methyltransferase-like protein 24 [Daphnia pulicaria]